MDVEYFHGNELINNNLRLNAAVDFEKYVYICAAQPYRSKYSHIFYDHSHVAHIWHKEIYVCAVSKQEIGKFHLNGQ